MSSQPEEASIQDGQRKRSKRHRRHRNHISKQDMANSNADNVMWAQQVNRENRRRFGKGEFATLK